MKTYKKLNKLQITNCKDMYMKYVSVSDIASRLDIPRSTVQNYVNSKWKSERVLRANELLTEFSDSKIALMSNTFSDSFKAIQKWIEIKSRNPEDLRPHDVKTMMSVITEMDKITRLDAGNPTDIIAETAPVDVIEIRKRIVDYDPFVDYKDLQKPNKELEDDKEDIEGDLEDKVKDDKGSLNT